MEVFTFNIPKLRGSPSKNKTPPEPPPAPKKGWKTFYDAEECKWVWIKSE